MQYKHLIYIALSMSAVLCSCSADENDAPDALRSNENATRLMSFSFDIDEKYAGVTELPGIVLLYPDGETVSSDRLPAEKIDDCSYSVSAECIYGKTASDMVCLYPYRSDLTQTSKVFDLRIGGLQYPSGTSYDPEAMLMAGTGRFDASAHANVSLTELLTPTGFTVSGLGTDEKIYWLTLQSDTPVSGNIECSVDGDAVRVDGFSEDGAGFRMTAAAVSGTGIKSFRFLSAGTMTGVRDFTLVTDGKIYEGAVTSGNMVDIASAESVCEAVTYDFTDPSGDFSSFVPKESGSTIEKGRGILVKGDLVSPGTVSIPTIDERQIVRVICLMDKNTDCSPHLMWLESYNGTSWDKVGGTDKLVSSESLAENGGLLDFELPKASVSAKGVYRVARGVCMDDICITNITIAHEAETCSHDPRSILDDGYDSGWVRAGTSAADAISKGHEEYDPEDCIVVDMSVSHVDDGSGSLKIGHVTCDSDKYPEALYKPWQGWRYADMAVTPGDVYQIYFCVKAENMPAGSNTFLSLGFKNASNQWITGWVEGNPSANSLNAATSKWVDTVKGTHDWIKLTGEVTVPEDAVKMSYFQIQVQNIYDYPEACVWFDDFNVVKIN